MSDYFARLTASTPTRVWVNNPTRDEIDAALAHGAVGCTTNPAYGGGLIRRVPNQVLPIVDRLLTDRPSAADAAIADAVQAALVEGLAGRFRPLFDESNGKWGYVSIQGSPETDDDAARIWQEATEGHALGPNVAPKIPATAVGLVAFDQVVAAGWPVIVTEVFAVDQLISVCERYLKVTRRAGTMPRFFISPITGILGDHLKKVAKRDSIDVPTAVIDQAGVGLARRCASIVAERQYPVTLLFGGARGTFDLTGLVGAAHCATINWSTFEELLALDPPIDDVIHEPLDPDVERQLLDAFPDVWRGWEPGRLSEDEYADFGPVQHFRDNFLAGWRAVLSLIAERREANAATARAVR